MWRRSKPEQIWESKRAELGEECAAFLSGTYLDYVEARGRPIPAWAWINRLAHGDRADVQRVAAMNDNGGTPGALMSMIATHILMVLSRGVSLETLQRNTLVPLELVLAETPGLAPANAVELSMTIDSVLTRGLAPLSPHDRASEC